MLINQQSTRSASWLAAKAAALMAKLAWPHWLALATLAGVVLLSPMDVLVFQQDEVASVKDFQLKGATHRETLQGTTIWRVSRLRFLWNLGFGLAPKTTLSSVDDPVVIRLQQEKESDLAEKHGDVVKALRRQAAANPQEEVAFYRLRKPRETLDALRTIERSAGRFKVETDAEVLVAAERSAFSRQLDGSTVWYARDERSSQVVRVIFDKQSLFLAFRRSEQDVILRQLADSDPELFAVLLRSGAAGKSKGSGSSSAAFGMPCRKWCGTSDAKCANPFMHSFAAASPPPTAAREFRVIVVSSSRNTAVTNGEFKSSIDFLLNTLRNTAQDIIAVAAPVLTLDSDEAADLGLWGIASDLYSGTTVSDALDRSSEGGRSLYRKLKAIRDGDWSQVRASGSPAVPAGRRKGDIVIYIAPSKGNDACGQASAIGRDDAHFFALVDPSCLRVGSVMAHEVGHLLGIRHDIVADPSGARMDHGYRWPDWQSQTYAFHGDVMSTGTSVRLDTFSTVHATCDGIVVGDAESGNARPTARQSLIRGKRPDDPGYFRCRAIRTGASPEVKAEFSMLFDSGKSTATTPAQRAEHLSVIKAVRDKGPRAIEVIGFADQTGTKDSNLRIAYQRAAYAQGLLTSELPTRPVASLCVYGDFFHDPIEGKPDAETLAVQRRAQINVLR